MHEVFGVQREVLIDLPNDYVTGSENGHIISPNSIEVFYSFDSFSSDSSCQNTNIGNIWAASTDDLDYQASFCSLEGAPDIMLERPNPIVFSHSLARSSSNSLLPSRGENNNISSIDYLNNPTP